MVMLKKLEQLFSPKRNFISGFFLGIGVSLIVLFVSNSLKGSSLTPTVEEQGFYNVCVNSSFVSTTAHTVAPELQGSSGESNDSVIAGVDEKFVEGNENGTRVFMTAQWGKITEEDEDRSFWVEQESVRQKDGNFDSDGDGGTAQSGNSSEIFRFERLHGEGGRAMENSSVFGKEERIEAKFSNNSSNGDGMVTKDENNEISGFESQTWEMQSDEDSDRKCDIYDGQWVRDDSVPYYPAGSCPHVDMQFNCHLNRRPDDEFLKWKWQPYGCEIPRLNATDFLEKLKGKRLVFVGDSLNRNMWESLVCILRHSLQHKNKVYEVSGKSQFKKRGIYSFKFEEYNCFVDPVPSRDKVRPKAKFRKHF